MFKFEIKGGHLPVAVCYPEEGQTLCSESGAMSWMSPNMVMETKAGGFKKALGRMFSGESIFLNEYTAQGGSGLIAFASSFPGSIIPFEVSPGNGIIIQKKSFLAMEKGMELSVYFQKKLGSGLFGGEGFIMQKVSGNGTVLLEIDGHCEQYELGAGQSIIVDTGYLAAMSETCTMDIQTVKGAKNIFLGGEGLFHTRITGPGRVWLQSMPLYQTAQALIPYLPEKSSGNGINISLGDN